MDAILNHQWPNPFDTFELFFGFPVHAVRALDPETGAGQDLSIAAGAVSFALPAARARILVAGRDI